MTRSISILGVRVDDVTFDTAGLLVEQWIVAGGAHQIATVNPEFIMRSLDDPEFKRVLAGTDLNVPDGVGVLWASRQQGHILRERVGGTDLMVELCRLAALNRWRVFFLGAREGVAERAAALLAARFPGMIVAGAYAGSPLPADEAGIIAKVQRARPHVLFVAYGAPAQDLWIARNLTQLAPAGSGAPGLVAVGVGGGLDFVAGVQKRAPEWLQRAGLEWLHRLVRQPGRIRRQMSIPRFMWHVLLESSRK